LGPLGNGMRNDVMFAIDIFMTSWHACNLRGVAPAPAANCDGSRYAPDCEKHATNTGSSHMVLARTPPVCHCKFVVLILAFNASLARASLAAALHEHRVLLPAHLRTAFIVAWRVPRKLSALLVPFRFCPHSLT
jgi:hypothetical protein